MPSTDFRAVREDAVAQVAALHAQVFPRSGHAATPGSWPYGAMTLPDNRGAITFDEKTGWTHDGRTARPEFFRRSTLSL
jgi:hypothetical protein